jgi:hypothetical protein
MDGRVEEQPTGSLCLRHGMVMDSFPGLTKEQVMSNKESNKDFLAEFWLSSENVGKDPNPFMHRDVWKGLTAGRTWAIEVAYVTFADFEKHAECTPAQANCKVSEAISLRGERYIAVVMEPTSVPPGMPFILGTVWIKEEMKLNELFLPAKEQLRDRQAASTLGFLIQQDEDNCRGPALKVESILSLPTWQDIEARCSKFLGARKEKNAEMQLSFDNLRAGVAPTTSVVRTASRFGATTQAQGSLAAAPVAEQNYLPSPPAVACKAGASSSKRLKSPAMLRFASVRPPAAAATATVVAKALPRSSPTAAKAPAGVRPFCFTPLASKKRPADLEASPCLAVANRSESRHKKAKYVHKNFDLTEVFNGASPGRQTGPVSLVESART